MRKVSFYYYMQVKGEKCTWYLVTSSSFCVFLRSSICTVVWSLSCLPVSSSSCCNGQKIYNSIIADSSSKLLLRGTLSTQRSDQTRSVSYLVPAVRSFLALLKQGEKEKKRNTARQNTAAPFPRSVRCSELLGAGCSTKRGNFCYTEILKYFVLLLGRSEK